MRPDRIAAALRIFVEKAMGPSYVLATPFDIEKTFEMSSSTVPMFYVLFPGVDPTKEVEQLGIEKNKSAAEMTLINISMGQGQEEKAITFLKECA